MSTTQNENAWWSCDGQLPTGMQAARPTRRQLMQGTLAAALAAWAMTGTGNGTRSALAQVQINPDHRNTPERDILVTIFLRGGADGLSIIVPHGDTDYYRARPSIALSAPKDGRTAHNERAVDLDGFFGLHPSLAALKPLWDDGLLAPVHAVGSLDQTRSHFEAMATMERGLAGDQPASGAASGWMARHLHETQPASASPLRAVAFADTMPDSLRGATDVSVMSSLDEFRLHLSPQQGGMAKSLRALYAPQVGEDAIVTAGRETLNVLDTLRRIDPAHYKPENGATYPKSGLGDGLRQVACLIKGNVGLEVASLDRGGWDTHVGQGTAIGFLALQLADVGDTLAAFTKDLGKAHLPRVTVLVMTEFGRRAYENSGLGTDHGRASAMLALGGGVNGGKVYSRWPGLAADKLEQPGDLRVTTDYRDILAEFVAVRLGNRDRLSQVFPGDAPKFVGIAKARVG